VAVATAVVLITFSTISVSEDNLEDISKPTATSKATVSRSVKAVEAEKIPDTDISEEPLLICNQNIPLPDYLQLVMQQACLEYGVSYTLALAVAECESSFDLEADSGTCWGLMQINPVNYARFRELGIEPTQYEGNIVAGVFMLGELLNKYGDTHKALMAYNCGEYGASCLWEQGCLTSSYSRKVTNTQDKWQQILNDNQEAIIND
jgi:hypothetical protein